MTRMKNLLPYNQNSLDIYDQASKRKRDDGLRLRLNAIRVEIETAYALYNDFFNLNNLQALNANLAFVPHMSDLHSLYSFGSRTIRELKRSIDDLQPFPLSNICQNCTINAVNSMDHVLGQAQFPEFCVHPWNLFPSCTECNSYKSASFARNGTRRFLNLYCDQLPAVQYLFLDIFYNENGDLDYNFLVENRNGIDSQVFDLIYNHFLELNLVNRMKLHSIKFYTELRNSVSSRLQDLGWDAVARQVKREAVESKNILGLNHFEYVLQTEMIENILFRMSFISN
jgi:hypothetical protein